MVTAVSKPALKIFSAQATAANLFRKVMRILPQSVYPTYSCHKTLSNLILSLLTQKSSSAKVCLQNYEADRAEAKQVLTNTTNPYIDKNGKMLPSYAFGGVFYLPESRVKKNIIKAMDELSNHFPKNSLFRNPNGSLHITGLVLKHLHSQPFPREAIEAARSWAESIARLCQDVPAPVFSIMGIILTKGGVLYAKCYPHSDSFQNIRDQAQKLHPDMMYKDVFNLSLSRVYRSLPPDEYQKVIKAIERYFINLYLGTIRANYFSLAYFNRAALIAGGREALKEIHWTEAQEAS